jgi:hypothetical protein
MILLTLIRLRENAFLANSILFSAATAKIAQQLLAKTV